MTLWLGIDGGGTGCRAAVADASGRVLGRGEGGPANIATDPEGAAANILAAAAMALDGVGTPAEVHAGLGLAGANLPSAVEALRARLPFATARIATDAVTAAKGALGQQDGIVAALGTGSVFAVQRGGVIRQFGGRGFILGDEGSGAVLGCTLIARALRADDGFEAMTPLLQALIEEHGGAEGLLAYGLAAKPADFAALAPRVTAGGDPAAEAILSAAIAEVAAMVEALQPGGLPVVFLGGLGPLYAARLAGRWEIRAPRGTGLDGALLLAREGD